MKNNIGTAGDLAARVLNRLRRRRWANAVGGPKYLALKNALMDAAQVERAKVGELLPTEAELAAHTPFSLGTVQRAVRALVEEGMVGRRQGYGTFITAHARELPSPLQCRFLADDGHSFLPVFPRVLERVRISQTGPWSGPLGQRADNILRIDRIIDIADRFVVFARFHTRADWFPMLESMPASALDGESLTRLLVGKTGPCDFDQRATIEPFSDWICDAVDVASGTSGLVLSTLASSGDKPIYFQDLYVPPVPWQLKVS
jgi:DNA-binding GntR family transcriptional regulator